MSRNLRYALRMLRHNPTFFTYAEQNRTFPSIGVWSGGRASVTGLTEPVALAAALASRLPAGRTSAVNPVETLGAG
jgi:hypothetical protein